MRELLDHLRLPVDQQSVRFILGFVAIACALFSGLFWAMAAKSRILAPPGSVAGVGYGGTPIYVPDADGKIVDFLQTQPLQSKWNARAALMSALTAIAAALIFLMDIP
jgi:hypothetical protein